MAVSTGNFPELLWPGIRKIFGTSYTDWPLMYPKVFQVEKSSMAFEKVQGVTGFSLAGEKDQGGSIAYDTPYQGYQEEFVPKVYGIGGIVTREMYEDDQYRYIKSLPSLLARSMRQTEETIAWNHFNRAFSSSYVGADGLSLINALHKRVDGTTYTNHIATNADLTQTSLEAALQEIHLFTDDKQLKIFARAKTLVVPTGVEIRAKKILRSSQVTGSADNDVNVVKDWGLNLVVCPWLTDPDAWFLTTGIPNGLCWFWRRPTEAVRDQEFDTQNLKFATTARHSSGWADPRSIFGSPGV